MQAKTLMLTQYAPGDYSEWSVVKRTFFVLKRLSSAYQRRFLRLPVEAMRLFDLPVLR